MADSSTGFSHVLSRLSEFRRSREANRAIAVVLRPAVSVLSLLIFHSSFCGCRAGPRAAGAEDAVRRSVVSRNGMVVSSHHAAAQAGASILERGGNAVDAAVATAFAVGVAQPFSAGVGGGAFALIRLPDGSFRALDAREAAPVEGDAHDVRRRRVSRNMRRSIGPLAVAVPAFVPGMVELLDQHGTMTLAEVLAPAIALAEDGVEIGAYHAGMAGFMRSRLSRDLFAETWRIQFAPFDPATMKGQRLVQHDLAQIASIARKRR